MFINRKGISPLIATVLIIGFTVALAAIIMTWGQSFTKNIQEQTEETSGSQITCAQEVMFDVDNVCLVSGTTYRVRIKNDGTKKLEKVHLRFYKSADEVKQIKDQFLTGIESFGIESKDIDSTLSDVKQVEAVGVIKIDGKEITCSANTASFGDLEASTFSTCA
ncbi:MAG: hypothetical protein PHG05_03075 [Candidatus Nanoarchaeia archaeon]|nr:hypothetical protein [Candidatus Nanoarchaeia archaeon]